MQFTSAVPFTSYVAIGDSFTEGMGDPLPDGGDRGWADLVALGLALASSEPVRYANLAIRGRKLAPIVGEQLDAALALRPQLLSLNGGGNDLMRPRVSVASIAADIERAVDRAVSEGVHVVLASGANPSRHIPMGGLLRVRGDQLARAVRATLPKRGVTFVDNWADAELGELRYWSLDKLHLTTRGHERVAANVLAALGVPAPSAPLAGAGVSGADDDPGPARPRTAAYWREYVLPWIGRRLTGRSSGDARLPKRATLEVVVPPSGEGAPEQLGR